MQTSIVIVNYNTKTHLHACLTSIYTHCPAETEVIVVDNHSQDGSVEMVKTRFPAVKLIESSVNLGFGVGNNVGVQHATKEYVMLLNSDAVLQTDTATALSDFLRSHSDVRCVGPRVVLPNTHRVQPRAFGFAPTIRSVLMQSTGLNRLFPQAPLFAGIDGAHRWAREMDVDWISGVCMVMSRADYLAVSGFDHRFFMYCEDIELCLKLANLGKVVLLDDYDIVHIGGASSVNDDAKVRNSVWQQRHLLMIFRDYHGLLKQLVAKGIIGLGLMIRLGVGSLASLKRGLAPTSRLKTAWFRLLDLFGLYQQEGTQ